MKILFALFRYFPFGGLQRDTLRFAGEAAARGHEVVILTGEWRGERPPEPRIRVEILPLSGFTNAGRAAAFERGFLAYRKAHPEIDVFVVMNRMAGGDFYFAADNCLLGAWRTRRDWLLRRGLPRCRTYLKQEAAIFAPGGRTHIWYITPHQKRDYQQVYHTEEERFTRLSPGMNPACRRPEESVAAARRAAMRSQLGVKEDELVLLLVAFNLELKGADRLLAAVAALPDRLKRRVHVVLAGAAPSSKCHFPEAGAPVTLTGPTEEVPALLLAADLMVHPARVEATGTVLVEALSAGLPVIASGACGFAGYPAEADPQLVIPEPFVQKTLNEQLVRILDDLPQVTARVRAYAAKQDFTRRAAEAIDELEAWGCKEKKNA